jgi:hypothetical protein
MTFNEFILANLDNYPTTAEIAVPMGYSDAAQPVPVPVVEHDANYSEFRAADGSVLGRAIFPE